MSSSGHLERGHSVSYRRRWWDPRRYYACGNVSRREAFETAGYLVWRGERGVRIDEKRV